MKVKFEVITKKGRVTVDHDGATYAECLAKAKKTSGFVRIATAMTVNQLRAPNKA
jgi:enhancing lycopene biosynthesis protein 2